MNVFNTYWIEEEEDDDVRAWRRALTGFVRVFLDDIVCWIQEVYVGIAGLLWDGEYLI